MTPPTGNKFFPGGVDMPYHNDADRFHSRKSPRMNWFDYSGAYCYFITICTKDKMCIFGPPGKPNRFGRIAAQGLTAIPEHFPGACIDKYVIMPNHVHAIVELNGAGPSLPTIIGQYKSYVTREIHAISPDIPVWQTSFHDHVIRNQKGYEEIWQYIEDNPRKWEMDCFFSD